MNLKYIDFSLNEIDINDSAVNEKTEEAMNILSSMVFLDISEAAGECFNEKIFEVSRSFLRSALEKEKKNAIEAGKDAYKRFILSPSVNKKTATILANHFFIAALLRKGRDTIAEFSNIDMDNELWMLPQTDKNRNERTH
ncbi:MAG: hypothetical protein D6734_02100 [Candidatus Schekmanbacteria bacterium]|nr:MAG: hypothetical protein D6734_02100 [Candidatus Schekmanbacteria bacterium]